MTATPVPFATLHVREHLSLLAASEKRTLIWIARRLPSFINSDHLSALGLGSMAAAGLALGLLESSWAVGVTIVCLAANWFGDSLDGTLARVRNHQRPRYGYYVDHVIDLAGVTLLLVGLGASGLMTPFVAAIVLVAYLLVSAESYLATHTVGIFRISFLRFGPTELRILLAVGLLRAAQSPNVTVFALDSVKLFDLGGIVATIALSSVFVASALRNTRALFRMERVPPPLETES
jgi:phosphatidylglycerophosphate synthase